MSECPDCGSEKVTERTVTEWFPYATLEKAYQATFPVMTCECGFGWRDERSETAIEDALYTWLNWEPPFSRADNDALSAEADYYEGKLRGDAASGKVGLVMAKGRLETARSVFIWAIGALSGMGIGYLSGKHDADRWWKQQHLVSTINTTYDGVVVESSTWWRMSDGRACVHEETDVDKVFPPKAEKK